MLENFEAAANSRSYLCLANYPTRKSRTYDALFSLKSTEYRLRRKAKFAITPAYADSFIRVNLLKYLSMVIWHAIKLTTYP